MYVTKVKQYICICTSLKMLGFPLRLPDFILAIDKIDASAIIR